MAKAADTQAKDQGLRRLGGGRWQSRDERFTIEPQSGTWAVVDAEQTDDLGLPLVRGPFKSLTAAKAAIEAARGEAAPSSPLEGRRPAAPSGKGAAPAKPKDSERPKAPKEPEEPEEPRWFRDLKPDERRRATRLIERLTAAGARDPEGTVRRDLIGEEPPAEVDVLLAADCWYEERFAELVTPWLRVVRAAGIDVLVADPGRRFFPASEVEEIAEYQVRTTSALEDQDQRTARVYRFR